MKKTDKLELDNKLKLITNEDIINLKYTFKVLSKIYNCDRRTIKKRLLLEQINLIQKNQYILNTETLQKTFICKICGKPYKRKQYYSRSNLCSNTCYLIQKQRTSKIKSEDMRKNNPMFNTKSMQKMLNTQYKFNIKRKSSYEKLFERRITNKNISFVGDGTVWVGRMSPDYKVLNKLACIEVSSTWFNRDEEWAKLRINKLNKHGWICLVIFLQDKLSTVNWEELNNIVDNYILNPQNGYYYNEEYKQI